MRFNERAFRNQNSAAHRQLPGLRHSPRGLDPRYLGVARHSSKMTPQESRQVRFAAGLAAASLTLIALELLMHYVIGHPLVRRPSL